jgi:Fic family protein
MDRKSTDGIDDFITVRTTAILEDLKRAPSSMSKTGTTSVKLTDLPTSCLTRAQLLWVQRLVLSGQDVVRYGLRDMDVWLGNDSSSTAIFTPLPHAEVAEGLDVLLKNWVDCYPSLRTKDHDDLILAMATFHYDFLSIHPLLDGNGRVARALLRQQMIELLDTDIPNIFADKPTEYYESLQAANKGQLDQLVKLLRSYSTKT